MLERETQLGGWECFTRRHQIEMLLRSWVIKSTVGSQMLTGSPLWTSLVENRRCSSGVVSVGSLCAAAGWTGAVYPVWADEQMYWFWWVSSQCWMGGRGKRWGDREAKTAAWKPLRSARYRSRCKDWPQTLHKFVHFTSLLLLTRWFLLNNLLSNLYITCIPSLQQPDGHTRRTSISLCRPAYMCWGSTGNNSALSFHSHRLVLLIKYSISRLSIDCRATIYGRGHSRDIAQPGVAPKTAMWSAREAEKQHERGSGWWGVCRPSSQLTKTDRREAEEEEETAQPAVTEHSKRF